MSNSQNSTASAGAFIVVQRSGIAGLVPSQPSWLFGLEVVGIGLVSFLMPLVFQLQSWDAMMGVWPTKQYARVIVGAAASLPLIVGGTMLVWGSGAGLNWTAAGVIITLAVGVWNAWVLLVEILR